MSIPSHPAHSGTFLITTATYGRRRLFQVPANADLFVATLQHYRSAGHFKLYAFVVMPEHVHLLLTPTDTTLEKVAGLIKGGFSHRLGSKQPAWQRGFDDRRIRDQAEFDACRDYIHQNPVRKRYCEHAEEYQWSSAWRGQSRHGLAPDLGG